MSDNVELNLGSGGSVVATDDIGGFHFQLVKLAFGALETGTVVTSSAGLPTQSLAEGGLTDAAWDGSASSASIIALLKLIATRGGAVPVFV